MTSLYHTTRLIVTVTIVLLVLFFGVIWALAWFRRHYLHDEKDDKDEPAYTIAELREMYEDGLITGEEFERLRRKVQGRRPYAP